MPRIGTVAWVSLFLALSGCGPVTLRVEVPPPQEATVAFRLIRGSTPASPERCATPCSVKIASGTEHEATISADGYYPAKLLISDKAVVRGTHDPFWGTSQGDARPLVVPLIKRGPSSETSAESVEPARPAHAPLASGSVDERLKELERLRRDGLVSQQEYETKRRQILEGL